MNKRISYLFTLFVILFFFTGCGKDTSPSELIGTWTIDHIINEEKTFVIADLAEENEVELSDLLSTFTAKEDGTFLLQGVDESVEGTWKESKGELIIQTDEGSTKAIIEDDTLTFTDNEITLVFKKDTTE